MSNKRDRSVVNELQFNVAQLLKEATGATRHYDISTKTISKFDDDVIVVSPIVGRVKFLRTGLDILVTGRLEATIQKNCGRCLTTFTTKISVELEEQFHPSVDVTTGVSIASSPDVDEANYIDAQHILDLLEVTRQNFLLESDGILYCDPDCQGLCPQCGQDQNTGSCTCEDVDIDIRWAGLKALQIED